MYYLPCRFLRITSSSAFSLQVSRAETRFTRGQTWIYCKQKPVAFTLVGTETQRILFVMLSRISQQVDNDNKSVCRCVQLELNKVFPDLEEFFAFKLILHTFQALSNFSNFICLALCWVQAIKLPNF